MFPPMRLLHTRLLVRSRITLARGMSSGASQQQGASASTPTASARDDLFYDPSITLSRRQREVFTRVEDVPPAPPMDDHGFLYGLKGSDVSALSDAVKRALSTRTGSLEDLKQFKTAQMIERLVTLITERIKRLSQHMAKNGHDTACQRTLQILTSRRRKLLQYMIRKDFTNYRVVVKELGLRPLPIVTSRHPAKVRTETHAKINARNQRVRSRSSRGSKGH